MLTRTQTSTMKGRLSMLFARKFGSTKIDERIIALHEEVTSLTGEVRGLRRDRDDLLSVERMTERIAELQRGITALEISKAKVIEDNERKVRETEHRVGLLRVQQEHEVANARRETTLEVRESNLANERERFEAEMKFQREHMDRTAADTKELLVEVLKRLPNIEVALDGGVGSTAQRARRTPAKRS